MRLIDEISFFLEKHGFACSRQMRHGLDVICTSAYGNAGERVILPLEISESSEEDAGCAAEAASECVRNIAVCEGYPLIITEDRWHSQGVMTRARLLAHLEAFNQAYARNCEVRKIEKAEAQAFLAANHSYGDAACRYRYGLFLKRYTGHGAAAQGGGAAPAAASPAPGDLVAVATFSNARRWKKGDKEIRSYEWTRYASLPGLRINGGMGKLLKAFIKEVDPDDIMSYADLEWSEGDVYRQLGFTLEGHKDPVTFIVDTGTWRRSPVRPGMTGHVIDGTDDPVIARPERSWQSLYFRNFGSNKYRLKLTEYE